MFGIRTPLTGINMQGLLGQFQQPQGLLGGMNTQNMMQQYLQNLFMRRYQPPAIQQQPGMVSSQMGPGGMRATEGAAVVSMAEQYVRGVTGFWRPEHVKPIETDLVRVG